MIITGLLGWPVGHSRSPAMHNAAFAATGIEGVYLPLAAPPPRLGEAVAGLRALGFAGANVTIPHKQAVLPYLDELSPAARAIGAANTLVVREDGSLFGDNTDAPGFLADLAGHGIDLEYLQDGGALILGAGGSARAVAFALASAGVPARVCARRFAQAVALTGDVSPHLAESSLITPLTPSSLVEQGAAVALIANCTPVGMTPHSQASPLPEGFPLRPHHIVYDLVYNPPNTILLQQAGAAGARGLNGLGMLLHQGALAWELWTGQPAPLSAMQAALISTS